MKQRIVQERKLAKGEPLSVNAKIQIIQSTNKTKKEWNLLDKADKQRILDGMDIAIDIKWILQLFEDLKDR